MSQTVWIIVGIAVFVVPGLICLGLALWSSAMDPNECGICGRDLSPEQADGETYQGRLVDARGQEHLVPACWSCWTEQMAETTWTTYDEGEAFEPRTASECGLALAEAQRIARLRETADMIRRGQVRMPAPVGLAADLRRAEERGDVVWGATPTSRLPEERAKTASSLWYHMERMRQMGYVWVPSLDRWMRRQEAVEGGYQYLNDGFLVGPDVLDERRREL